MDSDAAPQATAAVMEDSASAMAVAYGITATAAEAMASRLANVKTRFVATAERAQQAVDAFDGNLIHQTDDGMTLVLLRPAAPPLCYVQIRLDTDAVAVVQFKGALDALSHIDEASGVFARIQRDQQDTAILMADGTLVARRKGVEWALRDGEVVTIQRRAKHEAEEGGAPSTPRRKLNEARAKDEALGKYQELCKTISLARSQAEAHLSNGLAARDAAAAVLVRARAAVAAGGECLSQAVDGMDGSSQWAFENGAIPARVSEDGSTLLQIDERWQVKLEPASGSATVADLENPGVVANTTAGRRLLQTKDRTQLVWESSGDRRVVERVQGGPRAEAGAETRQVILKPDGATAVAESGTGVQMQMTADAGAIMRRDENGDMTQFNADGSRLSTPAPGGSPGQTASRVIEARALLVATQVARDDARAQVAAARAAVAALGDQPRVLPQADGSHVVLFANGDAVRVESESGDFILRERSSDGQTHLLKNGTCAELTPDGAQSVLMPNGTLAVTAASGLKWARSPDGAIMVLETPPEGPAVESTPAAASPAPGETSAPVAPGEATAVAVEASPEEAPAAAEAAERGATDTKAAVEDLVKGVKCVADGTVAAAGLVSFEQGGDRAKAQAFALQPCDKAAFEAERRALQDDPEIQAAIDAFWRAFGPPEDGDEAGAMDEAKYAYMHVRVQKALVPGWDAMRAIELAQKEFAADLARGLQLQRIRRPAGSRAALPTAEARRLRAPMRLLDFTSFFASIFEIADVWTEEVDSGVYAHFLWQLYKRIVDAATGAPVEPVGAIACMVDDGEEADAEAPPPEASTEPTQEEVEDVRLTWNTTWIGGVRQTIDKMKKEGKGKGKGKRGAGPYAFSDDGHTAAKSEKVGAGIISVIRASAPMARGKLQRVRLRIGGGALQAGLWPGDLDIGLSTIRKKNRRSRLADDTGVETEFCVCTPRMLPQALKARCHVHAGLRVGDVVSLLVDLRGGDGDLGKLTVAVAKRDLKAEDDEALTAAETVFETALPALAAGKKGKREAWSVCAAVRKAGLTLSFL